jgi:hypothetical protein
MTPAALARALAVLAATAAMAGAATAPANLIPDGDFEHPDQSPMDWTGFGPGAAVIADPDQPNGHVLMLKAAEGAAPPAPVRARVLGQAMAHLLVSARVRGTGLRPPAASASAAADDPAAAAAEPDPLVTITITGSGMHGDSRLARLGVTRGLDVDWTTLSALVEVPPGIIGITAEIALNGTGTVWVDDVRLTPEPALPTGVVGTDPPKWLLADASLTSTPSDPTGATTWLHLQPVRSARAVAWASMAADWRRVEVSMHLRGSGMSLLSTRAAAPSASAAATTLAANPRAGVLLTWVDDHNRPLSATYDDLMLPGDGDWPLMRMRLDLPRPDALLRLEAVDDDGGSLDVMNVQVLPVLAGE